MSIAQFVKASSLKKLTAKCNSFAEKYKKYFFFGFRQIL